MSHDDFMDAIFSLELANVPGPYFACLHPRQLADWRESLRSEGGAAMFNPATAAALAILGQGFAGEYLGINIFKMSDVTESGGNKEGFFWGAGAFGYKIAQPDQRLALGAGASVMVSMDEVLVEVARSIDGALTKVAGNAWCGVTVKEQARLVGCVTDA